MPSLMLHLMNLSGDLIDRTYKSNEIEKYFYYFSIKTYVEGTQKNHLIETVLLST